VYDLGQMANGIGQAVATADALRATRGLTHRQFADVLGRDESEWAHLRAARRDPSEAFTRALRAYAAQVGGIWPSRVDVAIQQDALAKVA
jgi:hypothetical protein